MITLLYVSMCVNKKLTAFQCQEPWIRCNTNCKSKTP